VLEAVRNDGNALEWASEGLRDDKDVVLEAVCTIDKTSSSYLCLISRLFFCAQVLEDRSAVRFASRRQRRDVDVVMASLQPTDAFAHTRSLLSSSISHSDSNASDIQVLVLGENALNRIKPVLATI